MDDLVPVRARDCTCPNTPHAEGDFVSILPRPSLDLGLEAQYDLSQVMDDKGVVDGTRLKARWLKTYIRMGAVAWNLTDADGAPVPFDVNVILADYEFAYPIADRCDDLYSEAILRPLMARLNAISPNGRTAASTSRPVRSIRSRPVRSSPNGSAATVQ